MISPLSSFSVIGISVRYERISTPASSSWSTAAGVRTESRPIRESSDTINTPKGGRG
jgi:hypothetical protein